MGKLLQKLSIGFFAVGLLALAGTAEAAIVNPKPCDWCTFSDKPDQCRDCCERAVLDQSTVDLQKCHCRYDLGEIKFRTSVGECIQTIGKTPGGNLSQGTVLPGGQIAVNLAEGFALAYQTIVESGSVNELGELTDQTAIAKNYSLVTGNPDSNMIRIVAVPESYTGNPLDYMPAGLIDEFSDGGEFPQGGCTQGVEDDFSTPEDESLTNCMLMMGAGQCQTSKGSDWCVFSLACSRNPDNSYKPCHFQTYACSTGTCTGTCHFGCQPGAGCKENSASVNSQIGCAGVSQCCTNPNGCYVPPSSSTMDADPYPTGPFDGWYGTNISGCPAPGS